MTAIDPQHVSSTVVQVTNISKTFAIGGRALRILTDISFGVHKGEFVGIEGPSGSGKSTLLNIITGIDYPTTGEIIVADHPIHNMSQDDLAAWRGLNVGIIFQFFQMLPALNLLQNVILPMDLAHRYARAERKGRAEHLLERVGIADQMHKLPNMVSGGEQQRAAIARALANDPPLIVADEPTGNLDISTATQVFELFNDLVGQGKTMIMVTHNKELASRVPRVIEIAGGQIISESNDLNEDNRT